MAYAQGLKEMDKHYTKVENELQEVDDGFLKLENQRVVWKGRRAEQITRAAAGKPAEAAFRV